MTDFWKMTGAVTLGVYLGMFLLDFTQDAMPAVGVVVLAAVVATVLVRSLPQYRSRDEVDESSRG